MNNVFLAGCVPSDARGARGAGAPGQGGAATGPGRTARACPPPRTSAAPTRSCCARRRAAAPPRTPARPPTAQSAPRPPVRGAPAARSVRGAATPRAHARPLEQRPAWRQRLQGQPACRPTQGPIRQYCCSQSMGLAGRRACAARGGSRVAAQAVPPAGAPRRGSSWRPDRGTPRQSPAPAHAAPRKLIWNQEPHLCSIFIQGHARVCKVARRDPFMLQGFRLCARRQFAQPLADTRGGSTIRRLLPCSWPCERVAVCFCQAPPTAS